MTVNPMSLEAGDAMELGQLLGFIAGWLAADSEGLEPSLCHYVGNAAYGIEELRTDVQRFEFLLGGGDGSSILGDIGT